MKKSIEFSNELYTYIKDLLKSLDNEKSYTRVKGFRLICLLSKYDKDNIINKNIDYILSVLDNDKPTSIRQYLAYLLVLIDNKPELYEYIINKVNKIDLSKFKDSMSPLIEKDIEAINKYNHKSI